jgi:hypothetical protein
MILQPYQPKILRPVPKTDWYKSSAGPGAKFRLQARRRGKVIWTGWFDDRDDADVFLYAISIGYIDKSLWRLPTPMWPGLDPDLEYYFSTVVFLTTTGGATWTVPTDWSNTNSIECVGAGAGGARGLVAVVSGPNGGGGGAYAKISNVASLTPGGSATYNIPTGGAGAGTDNTSGGSPGSDTWMRIDGGGAAPANTTQGVLADSGVGGTPGVVSGGTGGTTANSVGTTTFRGGNGTQQANGAFGAGGGGGAAGPNGNGGDATYSGTVGGTGGTGDNGSGGTGGAGGGSGSGLAGGNGNAGTEWDATHGSGGGGGGGGTTGGGGGAGGTGGSGGLYGSAGAGGGYDSGSVGNGGSGRPGLIVATYDVGFFFFGLPWTPPDFSVRQVTN